MKLGIDFDNTIVSYSDVFYKAALEKGLIPKDLPTSKGHVRDYLRKIGKEKDWTELQGYVYGQRMDLAFPYPGLTTFLTFCKKRNIDVTIISHKTLHPYLGPKYDLHQSAKEWLKKQDFYPLISEAFFELTLEKKLGRIKSEVEVFIDDLPELLLEKEFPEKVQKILFDPEQQHGDHPSYKRLTSWKEIHDYFS